MELAFSGYAGRATGAVAEEAFSVCLIEANVLAADGDVRGLALLTTTNAHKAKPAKALTIRSNENRTLDRISDWQLSAVYNKRQIEC